MRSRLGPNSVPQFGRAPRAFTGPRGANADRGPEGRAGGRRTPARQLPAAPARCTPFNSELPQEVPTLASLIRQLEEMRNMPGCQSHAPGRILRAQGQKTRLFTGEQLKRKSDWNARSKSRHLACTKQLSHMLGRSHTVGLTQSGFDERWRGPLQHKSPPPTRLSTPWHADCRLAMFHVKRWMEFNGRQGHCPSEDPSPRVLLDPRPIGSPGRRLRGPRRAARPNVRGSRIPQVRPTPVRQASRLAKHTPRETYGAQGYGDSPDQPWGLQQPMPSRRDSQPVAGFGN